jgi:hypothetical protein
MVTFCNPKHMRLSGPYLRRTKIPTKTSCVFTNIDAECWNDCYICLIVINLLFKKQNYLDSVLNSNCIRAFNSKSDLFCTPVHFILKEALYFLFLQLKYMNVLKSSAQNYIQSIELQPVLLIADGVNICWCIVFLSFTMVSKPLKI